MPQGNDGFPDGTDEKAEATETNENDQRQKIPFSRRRLLQVGGVGIASTLAVGSAFGGASDHPNTIVFDGTVSSGKSKYEFAVSGTIEPHPDAGPIEVKDTIDGSSVTGAVHRDKDAYRFSGQLTALDVNGDARVSLSYGDETDTKADRLQLVAGSDASIDYTFTTTDKIVPVTDGEHSAEDNDEAVENSDGTWTATGYVGNGYGDTFDFWGDVANITPIDGDWTLFLNGTEVTAYDLIGEEPPKQETRQHSYSFEGTGNSWADYYLEVEDGSEMIASTVDGAVIEPDFHWVSDDGTKAAGRVDPGERHAYEFDNLVLDVTIEGEADAFVNGSPSNLDYYPQPGATGDGWKGGFPWQEADVKREHSYSFEGTGNSWADYYLEVEDNAQMVATTLDGAVIEPDFHWVSDDGTKAAGRVDPGERHAYEFDNLVLDVTIEGEADAFVDGSPSNLDYYPQPGATGDGWKGGFPWQDEETTTSSQEPLGGGSAYGNTVSQSEADVVVRTRSELDSALSSASAGDVVFVPGGEQISLGNRRYDIPDGVTLASSRGVNGSSGALLYTDSEPWKLLTIDGSGRLTGVRLRGPHPGDDMSKDSSGTGVQTYGGSEVDNCDIWGFSYAGVRVAGGDGAHVHHCVIRENNTGGIGYGVAAESGTPTIEYNYFNFNRHSVKSAGDNPGYVARYNHFGPKSTGGVIDVHKPAGVNLEVHHNIVEPVESTSGHRDPLQSIQIRGTPEEAYDVHDNWFFNDLEPRSSPAGWTNEAIIQATESTWANIDWWDNYYGENASVSYSDIIPGYDGWRSP
jgi:hypothetical protein